MLTTLPPSSADCLEIWEPQPPGTLRACPGLYRDCLSTRNITGVLDWIGLFEDVDKWQAVVRALMNLHHHLPLALQPTVSFGLSSNVLPFVLICHQLSPPSQSQHLKISFYFLFPSFPGSSPSPRPFQFLSEDLFGHPILLNSL